MKLYFAPGACSLSKPHIVVHEAGLADRVALAKVDLRKHVVAGGADYHAINPKGYVPALTLDDGTVLTEGPVIVLYLADQAPAAGLAPACGTLARYRLQEMLNFISTSKEQEATCFLFRSDPADPSASDAFARGSSRYRRVISWHFFPVPADA